MGRRLGKVLLLLQPLKRQLRIFGDPFHQRIVFFLFVLLHIDAHKAVKLHLGCRHGKPLSRGIYLHGSRLVDSLRHPACHKPLPDQLIQSELVSGKRFLDLQRNPGDIGRTDRLVGILDLLSALLFLAGLRCVLCPVFLPDKSAGRLRRLVGDSGGIRSQIGNDTCGAVALDIYALIQLLRQPHGLLRGKVQYLAGFLLQRGGGKRQRRLLDSLAVFYRGHLVLCLIQYLLDLLQLFSGRDRLLRLRSTVILGQKRLLLSGHRKGSIQRPVLFRNKGVDLLFSVADDAQRHRLDTPRAQSPLDLRPQHRRYLIAHHPVQTPSCLLGIHQIHVDLSGVLQRFFDRRLRDLIKSNAVNFLVFQFQRREQVPGNSLPLAVRVRCQIYLLGFLHFFSQIRQNVSLPPDRNILRLKIMLHINSERAARKIPHMAVAGRHFIISPQKLLDRLHLGR